MFNALMGILIATVMFGSVVLIVLLTNIRYEMRWKNNTKQGKDIIKWCNIGIGISVAIMIASVIFFFQYLSITLFTITIN